MELMSFEKYIEKRILWKEFGMEKVAYQQKTTLYGRLIDIFCRQRDKAD